MASEAGPVDALSAEAQPLFVAAEKRQRWFELGLVLLVAFGGSLFNAVYLLSNGPPAATSITRTARWLYGFEQETVALLLLGYVLSRRGWSFKNLGLSWSL